MTWLDIAIAFAAGYVCMWTALELLAKALQR